MEMIVMAIVMVIAIAIATAIATATTMITTTGVIKRKEKRIKIQMLMPTGSTRMSNTVHDQTVNVYG